LKADIIQKTLLVLVEYGVVFLFCFSSFTYMGIFGIYSVFLLIIFFDYFLFLESEANVKFADIVQAILRIAVKCSICYAAYSGLS
jgi:hypothetical protein